MERIECWGRSEEDNVCVGVGRWVWVCMCVGVSVWPSMNIEEIKENESKRRSREGI